MAKAILVMDMPKNCLECPCPLFSPQIRVCMVTMEKLTEKDKHERPKHCPWREVPQKKEYNHYQEVYEQLKIEGYNACIDEILGGGE